ncbi:MAG: DUF6514 family protein [Oscillospiraceae bacterium]|jgi:hypothetical protein|nr:DUF6514 family protein [Oscillospiraceae bacterium]
MSIQLITRVYVYLDDAAEYTLEYYLESGTYSRIRDILYKDGTILSESTKTLSNTCSSPQKVIHYLARNFVFPVHLSDIVDDVL